MNIRKKLRKLVDKHCNEVKSKREEISKLNKLPDKINKKPHQR